MAELRLFIQKYLGEFYSGEITKRTRLKRWIIQLNQSMLFVLIYIRLLKLSENPKSSFEDAIENIDIGGPSMIRAQQRISNQFPFSQIPISTILLLMS